MVLNKLFTLTEKKAEHFLTKETAQPPQKALWSPVDLSRHHKDQCLRNRDCASATQQTCIILDQPLQLWALGIKGVVNQKR